MATWCSGYQINRNLKVLVHIESIQYRVFNNVLLFSSD
ncbi:hypothetical protein NT01EI_2997 [Edwardsiella ictaluri 93-146]|uniref:Uncharacterized protein n=1 Tax=Edwardsiella ictaluri (strain 93-146) TaxID=634503 RepID=C5B8U8_EDWI9|nr:hypothetical protein NT01EI_2997 [Edwardsiella ictaluri 93-146]